MRLVDVGELDKSMTTIKHNGRVWHILPNETEAAFIARVRNETTGPRAIFLTS